MNKEQSIVLGIIILIIIVVAGIFFWKPSSSPSQTGTPDTSGIGTQTQTTDQTLSDGTITLAYSAGEFGLATTPEQITVKAYIPPCDANFNYCLYYNGTMYQGTNFESAGVRIQKRTDLATSQKCLNTPPSGHAATTLPDSTRSEDSYSSSVFPNVGDAGAGHIASGTLYRLFVKSNSSCYEFETRIGQTQYANYPAGSIKQFTTADQDDVQTELARILRGITLPTGEDSLFQ